MITGTESTEEAGKFYKEAKQIFAETSMNLRDWTSNDRGVQDDLPLNDKYTAERMKVLGLSWIVREDTLTLNEITFHPVSDVTKRHVLRTVESVYDPLGLFSPVTLQGKLFLQELWSKKLSWDKKISNKDKSKWSNIEEDLKKLPQCRFPRYIGLEQRNHDEVSYQLVGFCDASKHAYAGIVYLYQQSGNICKVDLVFSKLRLAPSKPMVSIPHLELLAALIGTRAIQFVANQLKQLKLTEKHLWIDSQCVLNWIGCTRHASRFIGNRTAEIRKHKDITFQYVPSKDNPADLASRRVCINDLLENKLWWHGPEWMLDPNHVWTVWETESSQDIDDSEVFYEAKLDVIQSRQQTSQLVTRGINHTI